MQKKPGIAHCHSCMANEETAGKQSNRYNDSMKRQYRRIPGALLVVLFEAGEMLVMKQYPTLFFPWYRQCSKVWISFLAGLFSVMPCSVWDIGAFLLGLTAIGTLIRVCIRKRGFLNWLSYVLLVSAVLLTMALQGWLGNHYAPKLSSCIGLEVKDSDVNDLYETTEYFLLKAAEYAPQLQRRADGSVIGMDRRVMAESAGASYTKLAEVNPVFRGSAAPVKEFSLIGEYLLYNGIIGMFMPITGEASVPRNVPVIPKPFAMCHEAAHRLGIASEQEANFCAFLACITNEDPYFVYSGYAEAFGYCYSALYSVSSKRAQQLYEQYEDDTGVQLVRSDRAATRLAYQKYESRLQDISDRINDTYLKTFSQESGIRSYGEVTDYLIAWHKSPDAPGKN